MNKNRRRYDWCRPLTPLLSSVVAVVVRRRCCRPSSPSWYVAAAVVRRRRRRRRLRKPKTKSPHKRGALLNTLPHESGPLFQKKRPRSVRRCVCHCPVNLGRCLRRMRRSRTNYLIQPDAKERLWMFTDEWTDGTKIGQRCQDTDSSRKHYFYLKSFAFIQDMGHGLSNSDLS